MKLELSFSISLIILLITGNIMCQSNSIGANILSSIRVDNQSSGISFNFQYNFKKHDKHHLTLGFGNTFTHRKSPEVAEGFRVIRRDRYELDPLGAGFRWTEDDFPGIDFEPKESVYYNFDIFGLYNLEFINVEKINIAFGAIFSLRDQSQISRFIYFLNYDLGSLTRPLENVAIPVYNYANFLDVGSLLEINYEAVQRKRLGINLTSRFKYYPKNNSFYAELGASLNINLKNKN